jgi:aquaporin Z
MSPRKLVVEFLGTALLVFFGAGVATLAFGFKVAGASTSAGVVMVALTFGLVLTALAYSLGPISGCHINPAVTIAFLVSRRIRASEAVGYWVAQLIGGIVGAAGLWAVFTGARGYSRTTVGLGTNGFGANSMIGLNWGGAFAAEVVLTFLFVFVVLSATSNLETVGFAGLTIGLALVVVHLIGVPMTGTSVNPARSLGPAIIVGGDALRQVWLFIVAPLIGGLIAGVAWLTLFAERAKPEERTDV